MFTFHIIVLLICIHLMMILWTLRLYNRMLIVVSNSDVISIYLRFLGLMMILVQFNHLPLLYGFLVFLKICPYMDSFNTFSNFGSFFYLIFCNVICVSTSFSSETNVKAYLYHRTLVISFHYNPTLTIFKSATNVFLILSIIRNDVSF